MEWNIEKPKVGDVGLMLFNQSTGKMQAALAKVSYEGFLFEMVSGESLGISVSEVEMWVHFFNIRRDSLEYKDSLKQKQELKRLGPQGSIGPSEQSDPSCLNCKYFYNFPAKKRRKNKDGYCQRYPVPTKTILDYVCGEHPSFGGTLTYCRGER